MWGSFASAAFCFNCLFQSAMVVFCLPLGCFCQVQSNTHTQMYTAGVVAYPHFNPFFCTNPFCFDTSAVQPNTHRQTDRQTRPDDDRAAGAALQQQPRSHTHRERSKQCTAAPAPEHLGFERAGGLCGGGEIESWAAAEVKGGEHCGRAVGQSRMHGRMRVVESSFCAAHASSVHSNHIQTKA